MSCGLAQPDEIGRLRREVAGYVEELGAPEPVVDNVRLAVSEALANVVLHAYVGRDPGVMIAEAWCDADHLWLRVCDEGRGLVPRVDSPGLGVGIPLMASMADDFSVASRDGTPGTIVALRFSLDGQSQAP
jgi:serine/threonine-protein kinase RsbW/stage II sporulation protein AB (anti-sigma F factor)